MARGLVGRDARRLHAGLGEDQHLGIGGDVERRQQRRQVAERSVSARQSRLAAGQPGGQPAHRVVARRLQRRNRRMIGRQRARVLDAPGPRAVAHAATAATATPDSRARITVRSVARRRGVPGSPQRPGGFSLVSSLVLVFHARRRPAIVRVLRAETLQELDGFSGCSSDPSRGPFAMLRPRRPPSLPRNILRTLRATAALLPAPSSRGLRRLSEDQGRNRGVVAHVRGPVQRGGGTASRPSRSRLAWSSSTNIRAVWPAASPACVCSYLDT